MTVITARYTSTCPKCRAQIRPGDMIEWERGRSATHTECPQRQEQPAAPIRFSTTGNYRESGPRVGSILRLRAHGIVTVLSVQAQYIREDGMSFGLMDESGWLFAVGARPATGEEAQPLLEQEERLHRHSTARLRLRELSAIAVESWERPPPEGITPEGERLVNTQDIYGGGEWWVVGPEYIWFVRNNGADGDDWSQNNVLTGGAGAIGWRTPYDQALDLELRQLAETLAETKE